MPYDANKHELEILKFWQENNIFERSVSERPENKPYVFYDGPPFATGTPHYGHFPSSIMKDVVPRYWTMQGYRVERVWGWDCHGLPIENIVEKELGTKSKKDIETIGVAKFNELCRSKVLGYVDEWEKTIHRLGRWADMKHAYRTMDLSYMESVWWVFKQLWDKGLIYKDYKSMHICPRCETTLSQQEVSEGYKDVKDLSVVVKFKVQSQKPVANNLLSGIDEPVYLLAWTTTPWTLPGNLLLAVGEDVEYILVEFCEKTRNADGNVECFKAILAKDIYLKWKEYGSDFQRNSGLNYFSGILTKEAENAGGFHPPEILKENFFGRDLADFEYEPPFPYFKDIDNAFRVVTGNFVTTTEGTGIVHIAPGYGQDDYEMGKSEGLPVIQHVGMDGRFTKDVTDFSGLHVKPIGKHQSTDVKIIKYLDKQKALFRKEEITHSYPHCWRCDTPLLNYATSSWFVKVTAIKEKAIALAKKINWAPEHIKEGRFGMWLEGARDWSISRQRFWASVMPIWVCDLSEEHKLVFGSVKDLEEKSGTKVDDLHKHILDEITFQCEECDGKMRRIPDVLDTWFDSGSMPYAQVHYPFANKDKFERGFPAQFIAEGQDQTRAWFYYLHVLATALRGTPAFQNAIVNGIVLAEDGKKMSKRLKNYPDPNKILETYGADALRYYMVSSPVVRAENLNLSEDGVREMYNKVVNTLWNVVEFYSLYSGDNIQGTNARKSTRWMDRWILCMTQLLVRDVKNAMEKYNLADASRPILEFVQDLSTKYVRRSRDRFRELENKEDVAYAVATLRETLLILSKVVAPFMPFIAEKIYQIVGGEKESVHLETWPVYDDAYELLHGGTVPAMKTVDEIINLGFSARKEAGIKVRQPLSSMEFLGFSGEENEMFDILKKELNIKNIKKVDSSIAKRKDQKGWIVKENERVAIALNIELTDDLKKEGIARELVRVINDLRKEMKLTRADAASVAFTSADNLINSVFAEFANEIKRQTNAVKIEAGGDREIMVENAKVLLSVHKL